ncbi:MAG: hypothetical protein AAB927_00355 [Patescibacteria group bacterium]
MAKDGKKTKKISLDENPFWLILNDPDFAKRCDTDDRELVARLQSLKNKGLPREELGLLFRAALEHTSDQRTGKNVRALSAAMTNLANGDIAFAVLEQCELPKPK